MTFIDSEQFLLLIKIICLLTLGGIAITQLGKTIRFWIWTGLVQPLPVDEIEEEAGESIIEAEDEVLE